MQKIAAFFSSSSRRVGPTADGAQRALGAFIRVIRGIRGESVSRLPAFHAFPLSRFPRSIFRFPNLPLFRFASANRLTTDFTDETRIGWF
jgi:hypothetical protein